MAISLKAALVNLVEYITSGDHYKVCNPYSVPQVKDALTALENARADGQGDYGCLIRRHRESAKACAPRIESVKIIWDVDNDPDLSYLEPEDARTEEENEQNAARLKQFQCGAVFTVGCRARAVVSYPSGNSNVGKVGLNHCRLENFDSGGLWGIESDSDERYRKEVEKDELDNLKQHLETYNIDTGNFDTLEIEHLGIVF
jgi:hypothetical protein